MFKVKGPQIHFWVSEQVVYLSGPDKTNSEGEEQDEARLPAPPVEEGQSRGLPPYHHVEIF
jgi:hypothetical protein